MKKLILGFLLLFMLLPCFGEIHSKRGSYDDISLEIFWDDTVSKIMKENIIEKDVSELLDEFPIDSFTITIMKWYLTQNDFYFVGLVHNIFNYEVGGIFFSISDNYGETLYDATFKSFNDAKKEFDRLCSEYYKKLKK